MPNTPAWIVCETSGRWTAALRVTLARQGAALGRSRILEVRSLAELVVAADETPSALVLIEVRSDNFGATLSWLFQRWQRTSRAVALLEAELSPAQASEALLEAGALAVIDSPRRIAEALSIAQRFAVSRSRLAKIGRSAESIADRAWTALPWQDA
jgi:hypothetical protein